MLFQSQINQYEAYTDRYLAFKVEYRKMVPYEKPKITFAINAKQAIASLQKFAAAVSELGNELISFNENTKALKEAIKHITIKQEEHQKFLLQVKSYLSLEDWKQYAWIINRIDPDNYSCFLNLICRNEFGTSIALEILPEVRKLYIEYLIPTHQWFASRKAYSKIEDKIDSLMEEEND